MIVGVAQAAALQLPAQGRDASHMGHKPNSASYVAVRLWVLEMQVRNVSHCQEVLQSMVVTVASSTREWLAVMGVAAVKCNRWNFTCVCSCKTP